MSTVGLFVPKPSSQVVVLAHLVRDLLVSVRQCPLASGHVRADCHSVSHSVRTSPAARRYAGSPVARIVITKSRSGPVRSSSPVRTARFAGVDDVDRPARRRLVGGRQGEDLADDVFAAVGVGEAPGVERTAAYRPVPADLGDPDPHPEQFAPARGTPLGLYPQAAGR